LDAGPAALYQAGVCERLGQTMAERLEAECHAGVESLKDIRANWYLYAMLCVDALPRG
jgi:hypothetical protein